MTSVIVSCKPGWYPPEDLTAKLDTKMEATLAIGGAIPQIVAEVVNLVDAKRPGRPRVKPEQVFVDYQRMHPRAGNGGDVRIWFMPDVGYPFGSPFMLEGRRVDLRDLLRERLGEVARIKNRLTWPAFDVVVSPVASSGCSVNRLGEDKAKWGEVDIGIDPA